MMEKDHSPERKCLVGDNQVEMVRWCVCLYVRAFVCAGVARMFVHVCTVSVFVCTLVMCLK